MFTVQSAVIAAVYAAMTYAAAMAGLAYGNIQFRFSEALTILAAFTPAAIPGLTLGCLLANITSPYGIADMICGTLATLIASYLSYKTRKLTFKGLPLLSALFPVITNAVIVGLEITLFMPEGFKFTAFFICAAEVALGELIICYALGIPLYCAIKKLGADKYLK